MVHIFVVGGTVVPQLFWEPEIRGRPGSGQRAGVDTRMLAGGLLLTSASPRPSLLSGPGFPVGRLDGAVSGPCHLWDTCVVCEPAVPRQVPGQMLWSIPLPPGASREKQAPVHGLFCDSEPPVFTGYRR